MARGTVGESKHITLGVVAVAALALIVVAGVVLGLRNFYGEVNEATEGVAVLPEEQITPTATSGPKVIPAVEASSGREHPVALVLGDSYAEGVGASEPDGGYAQLLGSRLGWDVVVASAPGGGYAKPGTNGQTLVQLYEQANVEQLSPDVVVVQSGLNDVSVDDQQTARAAAKLRDRLLAQLPDTPVVVVGEFWPFDESTPSSEARDRTIENVWADRENVLYLSPLGGGWSDFATSDDRHPDDAGHRLIADRIVAAMRKAGLLTPPA